MLGPDGVPGREQRRAHRARPTARASSHHRAARRSRRTAVPARGGPRRRQPGIRHDRRPPRRALTTALRELGAKTNGIPKFAPLLDTVDDTDLADATVTVDAPHAQKEHARYLVEDRKAHPVRAERLRELERIVDSGDQDPSDAVAEIRVIREAAEAEAVTWYGS
ncbi:hypothetical protein [Streptomyces sp. HC307]|uniref:hypothetical protein n=1 Tax=Streptomyces flavusporus TaxID=3385496 RepID=UPI00391722C2